MKYNSGNNNSSFQTALSPIFTISTITGITSFQTSNERYEKSTFRKWFVAVLMTSHLTLFAFVFIILVVSSNDDESHMDANLNLLSLLFPTILMCVQWVKSMTGQEDHIHFLEQMQAYDLKFTQLGVHIFYPSLRKKLYAVILLLTSINILALAVEYSSDIYQIESWITYVFIVVLAYPLNINEIIIVLIYMYTSIIRERFKIINEHISNLQSADTPMIYSLNEINLISPLGSKLSILKVLTSLHLDGQKLIRIMNKMFGTIMLLTCGWNFIAMTLSLYRMCMSVKYEHGSSTMLSEAITFATFFIDLLILCVGCHKPILEANNTGILIHQIDYEEELIKDQIEIFSLQIANEHTEFSAAGFFNINIGLLFSIAGGITTYLIILIQFSD